MDGRRPVLVGVGQQVWRDVDPHEALEPLAMLEDVARRAARDAGESDGLLRALDAIALVSFPGDSALQNAPRLLGARLGARPAKEYVSEVGGQIGVTLANLMGGRIARGETRVALIAGCNALRTLSRARKADAELNWTTGGSGTPEMVGATRLGSSKREIEYGMSSPTAVYPLFENALRARRGLDLETHRLRMGRLFSPFTDVAAKNPYAWFPTVRSAEELTTVTPENRMIAFPYPKYLNAVLETDQAGALLMLSAEAARSFGIPEERWVHWWGGACSEEEAWYPSERPDLAACPAMLDSTRGALTNAGVTLEEIGCIDFYSCFPAAVAMACEMLGIDEADPRGFTVTGGLPYAGGPASAYCIHSLAAMADRLREEPAAKGLVTGNGWYLTKHAASVWSCAPKPGDSPSAELPARRASAGMATAPASIDEAPSGRGVVEAYTVVFDRDGAPERGIVLGRSEQDRRFLANTPPDRDLLEDFVRREEVGHQGKLSQRDGRCVFEP